MLHLENYAVEQGGAGGADSTPEICSTTTTPRRGWCGGAVEQGGFAEVEQNQVEREVEERPNLARIATALNRPIRSFTWRDGMARVVLADGRIAAGLGDTKADAWARLVSVLGEG